MFGQDATESRSDPGVAEDDRLTYSYEDFVDACKRQSYLQPLRGVRERFERDFVQRGTAEPVKPKGAAE